MKYFKDENVRKKIFTGIILISFFFVLYNIQYIWTAAGKLVGIILPFIIGAAIAFVLNVPMRNIEKLFFRNKEKFSGDGWAAVRRILALICTLLLTIIVISLLLYMIIPQLADTISQLVKQIPGGIKQVTKWANEKFSNEPIIQQTIQDIADDWQNILEKIFALLKNSINSVLEGGINAVTGIVSGVFRKNLEPRQG